MGAQCEVWVPREEAGGPGSFVPGQECGPPPLWSPGALLGELWGALGRAGQLPERGNVEGQ